MSQGNWTMSESKAFLACAKEFLETILDDLYFLVLTLSAGGQQLAGARWGSGHPRPLLRVGGPVEFTCRTRLRGGATAGDHVAPDREANGARPALSMRSVSGSSMANAQRG